MAVEEGIGDPFLREGRGNLGSIVHLSLLLKGLCAVSWFFFKCLLSSPRLFQSSRVWLGSALL